MAIDFRQYVEGEKLSLSSPSYKTIEKILEEIEWTEEKRKEAKEESRKKEEQYYEYLSELINFLQSNTYITELEFRGSFSFYSPIKTLAQSSCLQNLRKLVLPSHLDAKDLKALAQSPHLKNLRELHILFTKINFEDLKALVEFSHLQNLKKLTIENFYNNYEEIETIAELQDPRIELDGFFRDSYRIFYHFLLRRAYFTMDEKDIKEMIMHLAPSNGSAGIITHILKNPDKYPFLINSRDEEGHTLSHFYTHNPEMQKFLFERGMIPEQKRDDLPNDYSLAEENIKPFSGRFG